MEFIDIILVVGWVGFEHESFSGDFTAVLYFLVYLIN